MSTEKIEALITRKRLSFEEILSLRKEVCTSQSSRTKLEKFVKNWARHKKDFPDTKTSNIRLGIVMWAYGNLQGAVDILKDCLPNDEAEFCMGLCLLEMNRPNKAYNYISKLYAKYKDDPYLKIRVIECEIATQRYEEGERKLEKLKIEEKDNPDVIFLIGMLYEAKGFFEEAISEYEKILKISPLHPKTLLRLAYLANLRGDDETSKQLCEKLTQISPSYEGALINLGLIYEDIQEYDRALDCYKKVLNTYPANWRARRYYIDTLASISMKYDEEALIRAERRKKMLQAIISDLPLETKIINALKKAGITTIGDLVTKKEDDLILVPNLGKTGIRAVKEALTVKGLALASSEEGLPFDKISPDVLNKPLSSLQWSTRLRNIFEKLGLVTIGELIRKSEDDLKNVDGVGDASLQEIKNTLSQMGLRLRE
jgi:DNA-directed RNA polymerase subunit alpha